MVFLGMLFVIDLRMPGAMQKCHSIIAQRLDKPMMIGFAMMLITGFLLYYAIPVRTTQSLVPHQIVLWCRRHAFLFRARMQASSSSWDLDPAQAHTRGCNAVAGLMGWGRHLGRTIATTGLIAINNCPTPCIGPQAVLMKWLPCNKTGLTE